MPTYEYLCDACGHQLEIFQSITAKTLKKCPECQKLKLRRLIGGGGGIIFKGGGFYQTDYRSKGYQDSAKKDTETSQTDKKDSSSSSKSPTKKEESPSKDKTS